MLIFFHVNPFHCWYSWIWLIRNIQYWIWIHTFKILIIEKNLNMRYYFFDSCTCFRVLCTRNQVYSIEKHVRLDSRWSPEGFSPRAGMFRHIGDHMTFTLAELHRGKKRFLLSFAWLLVWCMYYIRFVIFDWWSIINFVGGTKMFSSNVIQRQISTRHSYTRYMHIHKCILHVVHFIFIVIPIYFPYW